MKAMFEVIKYEGANNILAYRYPTEDFNTKSQLIVQQSQEAIFYSRGQLADTFTEGTYTLETKNIPILRGLINLPFGKESPFSAVVYFINKTEQFNIKWGTPEKVSFDEPKYGATLEVGACGTLTFKVEDSKIFLRKLIGQKGTFTQAEVMSFMQDFLKSHVQNHLANIFATRTDFDIITIQKHINTLSDSLKEALVEDFREYGLKLEKFLVSSVAPDKESLGYQMLYDMRQKEIVKANKEVQEEVKTAAIKAEHGTQLAAQASALEIDEINRLHELRLKIQEIQEQQNLDDRAKRLDADTEAYLLQKLGITKQQLLALGVLEKFAENEGAGAITAPAVGFGASAGVAGAVAGTFGAMAHDAFSSLSQPNTTPAQQTTPAVPGDILGDIGLDSLGGNEPTTPVTPTAPAKSKKERLQELKEFFEDELITAEEYAAKKAEIMSEI